MQSNPLNLPIPLGYFDEVLKPPGRYLNDHCFHRHDDLWHCFAITGPIGRGCYDRGSETSFLHASSRDLQTWTLHPDILEVNEQGPDSAHVFAPTVIFHQGVHHMLYTGVDENKRQRICLALSDDLLVWKRHAENPVIVPSMTWAKWPDVSEDNVGNCRDPHVIKLPDGRFSAYWVAETNNSIQQEGTCIMASVSDDLIHWQEAAMVALVRYWDHPPTKAVESPCVVNKDGEWWLFYKYGWSTWCVRGRDPFDFLHRPAFPIGYAHAAEIFYDRGKWLISHCSGAPDEPVYRQSNRTRGIFLTELSWPDESYPSLPPPPTGR